MGDVVLMVEDLKSASAIAISVCRICHEGEFESRKSLEAPCACSGTVKFAHRDCIQRWCNEKGNTVCEICLQKFEPGYAAPPVKASQLVDAVVTIRGSLEVPRTDMEIPNPESSASAMLETDYPECSFQANLRFTYCRTMALLFMVLLLARDLLALVTRGTEHYPFTLLTLLIIRASGIVLPMFVFIRIITAIQNSIKHPYQVYEEDGHHGIQVHS
ncbi:hypothetical protein Vadar_029623 [Vaccinium darrowii]|uniref:Uncharacterized protein n=1 Tax=Vaccinium darrowii TaxID=229202 RepID=A0ACB7XE59_9ERIC|nr:hypothetical protein Vadar_029623 [Vaccinium darrowii]